MLILPSIMRNPTLSLVDKANVRLGAHWGHLDYLILDSNRYP